MPGLTIDQFMNALSGQESGGDYSAENARTGAYGRFQILPSNWPSWSVEAGLPPGSQPTPENQEKVARFKLQQYYDRYGNWEDVASIWYSGAAFGVYDPDRKQGNGNEPSIREYVNSVMSRVGTSTTTGGTQMAEPKGKRTISGALKEAVTGAKTALNTAKTAEQARTVSRFSTKPYTPTGSFDQDVLGYWDAAEQAWAALDKYQASSSKTILVNEDEGLVYIVDGLGDNGKPVLIPDPAGTKILQQAMSMQGRLDSLYAAQKAGILKSGNDSAQAYLASEKDKAVEATRRYEDYISRIRDLVAIEEIPTERATAAAAALEAANAANSKRQSRFSAGASFRPTPGTDMSPFASAIKSTIPGEAPKPYNIPDAAFISTMTSGKVPVPPPPGIPPAPGSLAAATMVPATGIEQPEEFNFQPPSPSGITLPTITPAAIARQFGAGRFAGTR